MVHAKDMQLRFAIWHWNYELLVAWLLDQTLHQERLPSKLEFTQVHNTIITFTFVCLTSYNKVIKEYSAFTSIILIKIQARL